MTTRFTATRYKFSTDPTMVPLTVAPALEIDSDVLVSAADFDPDDEEITISALSEDWNGHKAGDLVVHGLTVEGHPFAVVAIGVEGTDTLYNFRPVQTPGNLAVASLMTDEEREACGSALRGTLKQAQALAETYDCRVDLTDASGFDRGWATADDFQLR